MLLKEAYNQRSPESLNGVPKAAIWFRKTVIDTAGPLPIYSNFLYVPVQ